MRSAMPKLLLPTTGSTPSNFLTNGNAMGSGGAQITFTQSEQFAPRDCAEASVGRSGPLGQASTRTTTVTTSQKRDCLASALEMNGKRICSHWYSIFRTIKFRTIE